MSLPTLFLSHGSPAFALTPGRAGALLGEVGRSLPRPRAVLIVSPHWITHEPVAASAAAPQTVHDFGGFPQALYALRYPAPGAPGLVDEVATLLSHKGLTISSDPARGLDHGAWVPLMHVYPAADVPVLQVSQPDTPSPAALLEFGRALAPLRETGVLVIGSGSLTHNLREFFGGIDAPAYAQAFADWMWAQIIAGDLDALLDYRRRAPEAVRAHPSDEHLLPLFFAIGAAGAQWADAVRLEAGISDGVLSMDGFLFGAGSAPLPAAATRS